MAAVAAGTVTGRRVPGCWLCNGEPEPPGIPHDSIIFFLIVLHGLLGHDKAAAFVLGGEPLPSGGRRPVVTVPAVGGRL